MQNNPSFVLMLYIRHHISREKAQRICFLWGKKKLGMIRYYWPCLFICAEAEQMEEDKHLDRSFWLLGTIILLKEEAYPCYLTTTSNVSPWGTLPPTLPGGYIPASQILPCIKTICLWNIPTSTEDETNPSSLHTVPQGNIPVQIWMLCKNWLPFLKDHPAIRCK